MKLCDKKNRQGEPCKLVAGHGTDHKGHGACKFHGGASPRKHGLYSEAMHDYLAEHIEKALQDSRLTQVEQQIAYKSALLAERNRALKGRQTLLWPEVEALVKISEAISRDIERWHKMKHGETHVIRIEKIEALIQVTVQVMNQFIPDPEDRKKALEMLRIGVFSRN